MIIKQGVIRMGVQMGIGLLTSPDTKGLATVYVTNIAMHAAFRLANVWGQRLFNRARPFTPGTRTSQDAGVTAYTPITQRDYEAKVEPFTPTPRSPAPNHKVSIHIVRGTRTTPYLDLDSIPKSIEVEPTADIHNLKIIGRNTGVYHYGGSEDTITLELSWYSQSSDLRTVYQKCQLVEALTKSDGDLPPPVIAFIWGGRHRLSLLQNSFFIVEKASYTLKDFHSGYIDTGGPKSYTYIRSAHATQTLILKRVSFQQLKHSNP
jgi:hypothetical protein